MTEQEAQDINERTALGNIGTYCPRSCAGRLAQVVAVGFEPFGGEPSMLVEYECSTGHRRVFSRERAEVATPPETEAPLGIPSASFAALM